ncbi:MAG: hypothetical protein WEB90_06545 [Gemmatimonadota bacterium]
MTEQHDTPGASADGAANSAHGAPRGGAEPLTLEAEAIVFGFAGTLVALTVRRRGTLWRVGGAARTLVTFLLLTPIVAAVPPHAPWAVGALTAGGFLVRRRWLERFTLERVEGPCPKCGANLKAKASRLRFPHPLACDACHHQVTIRLSERAAAELLGGLAEHR